MTATPFALALVQRLVEEYPAFLNSEGNFRAL